MKTVSVVIPCYGYAHYLEECACSVLGQNYRHIEIMVVADEQDVATMSVIRKLGLRYVHNSGSGLAGNRNRGIGATNGELIMCLDADDKLPFGSIEEHVELVRDDMTIAQMGLKEFCQGDAEVHPQGATLESLRNGNTVYCNAMFPRTAWDQVKFDESETMRLGWEDYLFWYELAKIGYKFATRAKVGLHYRKHSESMTQRVTNHNHDKIRAYMKSKHPELFP